MTIEILTFGCRLNTVESEAMRTLAAGSAASPADTVVVNTCAVTQAAEREARHAIARLHRNRPGAAIVVTGCAVQIDPARWAALPGVTRVLGNQEKLQPAHWSPGAGSAVGPIAEARSHAPAPIAGLTGRARAFLDVQQGCNHACTFCIIPQGRGPSRSVPLPLVANQVRHLVAGGAVEIVLTGVDLASWDGGLAALVQGVLAAVPDLPRLRLSSLDPAMLDHAFWDVFATEPRLMPHLHLSVQAGSDLVLKRMRRRHSRAAALAVVHQARRLRPGVGIGADLIAGFPTETDAAFAETLAFMDAAAIPYAHVFPYSPRAGTPAARMPQVPPPVRKERAARLRQAAAVHAGVFHAGMVGQRVAVVSERGGRGHTEAFAPVRGAGDAPGLLERRMVIRADASGLEVV